MSHSSVELLFKEFCGCINFICVEGKTEQIHEGDPLRMIEWSNCRESLELNVVRGWLQKYVHILLLC